MMTKESESPVSRSSRNCDDADSNGVELSETAFCVEFNDKSTSFSASDNTRGSTSPSQASSAAQFSVTQTTLGYDKGM